MAGFVWMVQTKEHIGFHSSISRDLSLKEWLFVIIVTIENALIQIICSLEQLRIMLQIWLKKEDQQLG